MSKCTIGKFSLFFFSWSFIIFRSSLLIGIERSVCSTKLRRILCISFSSKDSGLCIYHLFVWSNFNFLHNSQWISLPTQSSLVLYSFFVNLLHSLIMWLIVSSLTPYNLHLQFSCVLSILSSIWLVLMSLWRCPWSNGHRRRKWTRRHEFKSWTRLIAFHIALIPLGKVSIQSFSLQLWVNSRTD